MPNNHHNSYECPICHKAQHHRERMHGELLHGPMVDYIVQRHPEWTAQRGMCRGCLRPLRAAYIQHVLEVERGEQTALDDAVLKSLKEHELLAKNVVVEFEHQRTLGERVADKVATFGGSWRFIIAFGVVLALWIAFNSIELFWRPFDPFPFIFLNLLLSCLAAIQAPVIMMSQNRQEAKDRLRGEHDYRIDLKAELEIRHLHAKMDQLLTHQWQRLLEIQQIQMELMEQLIERR